MTPPVSIRTPYPDDGATIAREVGLGPTTQVRTLREKHSELGFAAESRAVP